MMNSLSSTSIVLLFCVCTILGNVSEFDLKVDYYEKLIRASQKASSNYKPRTSNGDFLDAANFSKIGDFGCYDFIIVGAGSAGSAVANRLSEVKHWKILVLEAGKEYDDLPSIPAMFLYAMQSQRDWGYSTTPQRYGFLGIQNNSSPYGRGKIVGGSSSINLVLYTRGNRGDYDGFALKGNPEWSYEDVLPYFKKLENIAFEGDPDYRGFAGPVNIELSRVLPKLHDAIYNANKEIGLEEVDYNGERQIGVSIQQRNTRFGRRESGANCYVEPARVRQNYKLVTEAFVTKVLIEDETAVGVQFVHKNKVYEARANLEVILSAGAINTPQILMLSGIGPLEHLQELDIPVVVDLPVGKQFKDHAGLAPLAFKTNYVEKVETMRRLVVEFLRGGGYYAVPLSQSVISYTNLKTHSSVPNVQYLISSPSPFQNAIPPNVLPSIEEDYLNKINSSTDIQVTLLLLHPKFSGTVKLSSKNPRDFPLIDPQIFQNEEDLEDIYQGIQFIRKLADMPALAKYEPTFLVPDLRQCRHLDFDSRDHWYCFIRHLATTYLHATSTVPMGPDHDPLACVDSRLRLYGIGKLRIVDNSVLPGTISGHTNAPAYMVGERAAGIIKEDYEADF